MDRSHAKRLVVRLLAITCLFCAAAPLAHAEETADIEIFAVRATVEGADPKQFDTALNEVKDALASSKFDTFRSIKTTRVRAPYGRETETSINDRYTVIVEPESKGHDRRLKMAVRIEEAPKKPGDPPRVALKFNVSATPGGKIVSNGLPLDDDGTLMVVLVVAK